MATLKGMNYLKARLAAKQIRVDARYKYYDMKNYTKDLGISTPKEIRNLTSCLGWCAVAVDSLADRLVFREFRNDNFDINGIFNLNNPDVLFDSAVVSALIAACCFIYISRDDAGMPKLQVIDGGNATGIMDQITGMLTEGYAVLERDPETKAPTLEAYLIPGKTYYYQNGQLIRTSRYEAAYPLLVPVVYRPDAKREFGHSRISRACMYLVEGAIRTVKRSEITAEFYSFPQKWVTGLSQDAEKMDKWMSAISYMMQFEENESGQNNVKVGQFVQQSMEPHMSQLKVFASLFAGEAKLTLDDLGFVSGNPSSYEAIKASHENLRLTARKAQRTFGTGFLNAGYLAACVRDEYKFARSAVYETKPVWEPVFEPDISAIGAIGDAMQKLNQAIPGYVDEEKVRDITGF